MQFLPLLTFADVFKGSFLENFTTITFEQGLLMMGVSLLLGILICVVYRVCYRGVLFSHSFCISLLAMDILTTLIIMTISSNIVLSLGMVGALSIIRFRTAIKDPMDIAFLYFSIAMGIMCGANLLGLALAGSVFVSVVFIVASRITPMRDAYILMVTVNADDEEAVTKFVMAKTKRCKLKSKAMIGNTAEIAFEVKLIQDSTKFLNKINAYAGVTSVTLVKSSGEYI